MWFRQRRDAAQRAEIGSAEADASERGTCQQQGRRRDICSGENPEQAGYQRSRSENESG